MGIHYVCMDCIINWVVKARNVLNFEQKRSRTQVSVLQLERDSTGPSHHYYIPIMG